MPGINEFEALITELGGNVEETTSTEEVTETEPEQIEEPVSEPESAPEAEPETETTPAPASAPVEDKSARAFAEMRTKLAGYEKPLKRAAEAAGLSVEEFLTKIDDVAVNKQAKDQGITPDILRRLEAAEQNSRAFQVEATKLRLQQSFNSLQNTFNLTDQEIASFAQTCINQGIDLTQPNINIEVLYRGLNYDTLVDKARQNWIKQDTSNRSSASAPVKGNGTAASAPNKIETMADLDKYLADMPN